MLLPTLIDSDVLLATCERRTALLADTLEIRACAIISMPLMMQGLQFDTQGFHFVQYHSFGFL